MTRLTITLATWLVCVSLASASLTSPSKRPQIRRDAPPAAKRTAQVSSQAPAQEAQEEEFRMTAQTVVLLNDRRCAYRDVPAHARIVSMEVAADRKTVLRVHFRTGK
jgi:hypothetical protein